MSRLIDADKALETVHNQGIAHPNAYHLTNYATLILQEAPTVDDVAPIRHGRWVPFHSQAAGDIQYCSSCEIGFAARTKYCPNCGAKMDGECDA